MTQQNTLSGGRPFKLVRLLSWSFFILILGSNLVLSAFVADFARRTLLEKQKDYALLLAENLNHQIFQRFTLPTLIGFGRIELKSKVQYERLDKVVRSTIHSFHVLDLSIYDFDKVVAYSLDEVLVGQKGLAGASVLRSLTEGKRYFEIISKIPAWKAFFTFDMAPESVVLKTVYTLRADRRLDPGEPSGPIMGTLEFSQDITRDYQTVINFERITVLSSFLTSLALFFVLLMILKRADRFSAERAAEKERLERELHQSEKLASMGRMVAGIAHEIRNPLGIIRSSSELLMNKAQAEDPASANARILEAIFQESKRLSRTVNDFLDYARPQKPRLDDVDLSRVLTQAVVFLEQRCKEHGVEIKADLGEGLSIRGDADLLYRAFYNILANSLEALDGPGTISVSVVNGNKDISITLCDSGPGFPEEALEQGPTPFYTTKDAGTGLGLTIVDNIFRAHGAEMTLANSPEGGACTTVRFPKE